MKILFAEDDFLSFKILEKYLQKWGYDYLTATNGIDAWEILKKEDDSMIALIDWMMPGIDGLEVCKKVKSSSFNNSIHIILLTAKSDNESIIQGLEAGASDYISKPYNIKILKARIDAGIRILEMNQKLRMYLKEMELLAENRAKQLIHSDRLATIGMLSSGIAHEINNPTTFISINVQTLQEMWPKINKVIESAPESEDKMIASNLSLEMENVFANMKNGVKRIISIVDSLKKYYTSDIKTKKQLSDISDVINESVKLCENRLKNDIELEIKIQDNLPALVMNSQEIEQVLVNLLINAADSLKKSIEKKIQINVKRNSDIISIHVLDTGSGISSENSKKIFNPFFTTKEKNEGTGMGLSISKNIIENHNGEIKVRQRKTGGTEFIIKLPLNL